MECFYNADRKQLPIYNFIPHQKKKAILINESNKSFTDKSARRVTTRDPTWKELIEDIL